MSAEKGAGALEGRLAFVEMGGEGLEHVGYPGHDFEGDLDIVGGRLYCEADGVVEEDLVRADLDQEGR